MQVHPLSGEDSVQKNPLAKFAIPMALSLALVACGARDEPKTSAEAGDSGLELPERETQPAIDSFYAPVLQRLDEDMRSYVTSGKVANIGYALVKNGEWVQTGYYGTRTLGGDDPVDEHTIYRI
jgi:CubicO group peptidase (beta-lactamase class C family)